MVNQREGKMPVPWLLVAFPGAAFKAIPLAPFALSLLILCSRQAEQQMFPPKLFHRFFLGLVLERLGLCDLPKDT